ncbi:MAG: hypothetical protein Q7R93_03205 [bacterium]|nr:hypothetical protein [bacterium]
MSEGLSRDTDFTVDEKQKAIQLTPEGIEKVEKSLGVDNLYTEKASSTCIISRPRCAPKRSFAVTKNTSSRKERLSS